MLHGGQTRQMKPIYEIDKQANNNEGEPNSTVAGEGDGSKMDSKDEQTNGNNER